MPEFSDQKDLCLGFFKTMWDSGACPELPLGAKVLELGCCEADWMKSMREARPDLHLTGIDVRDHPRPKADLQIQGDILTHTFPPLSFDAIVAVSMIEWAGIGHYGDPVDPVGDQKVMWRARQWIKPGGWMYLDTPFQPGGVDRRPNKFRVYDDATIATRLYGPNWKEVARRHFSGDGHPDGPYLAVVLEAV